ncbi:ExeM/NucH family extracellular endonuclease [Inhella gelatinilytica]|uniref:ExeM/NucH family extracellular endonuclease n=1 Tax=Inhella gelatinilytica TaxID=2795030 RepID=A0A931IV12_9BURK|nr:ExeM/NucH family extracellular endonuclease [Inhella gelatinilytica]MBH9552669.1 ExeM/NucH family extracellular endonuclease [Inhella gelatinilytica]
MSYTDLIISEYVEGSGNNKALEFFNGTGAAIDLAAGGYAIKVYFNGSTTAGLTIPLVGIIPPGGVFVLAHAEAVLGLTPNQTVSFGWFNGDDAIELVKGSGTVIDSIGTVGVDPGSQWGTDLVSTADNTLRRKPTVTQGDTASSDSFDPSLEWEGFATDAFSDLGQYAAAPPPPPSGITVTVSALLALAAEAGGAPGTFRITRSGDLSAPLTVAYGLSGSASEADYGPKLSLSARFEAGQSFVDVSVVPVDDTLLEGTETLTLNLQPGADYSVGATASATVSLADNDMPPPGAPLRISAIQGSGAQSSLVGQVVVIEAIVVGDFQSGGLNGFYVQEDAADWDADPATSEGLFISEGGLQVAVAPGDRVRVEGKVSELISGSSSLTRLSDVTSITVLSTGGPLPAPQVLRFPVASLAQLEALEGMRVVIPDALTVTGLEGLSEYGEVLLSSSGPSNQPGTDARLDTYTQFNAPSIEGFAAYQSEIALRTLVVDDGSTSRFPATVLYGRNGEPFSAVNPLRGGDTVSGLIGILDDRYASGDLGHYRLQPTAPVSFQGDNPRTAVPDVGGTLKVASFNVLNFFNGDGAGTGFPTARGADSLTEFQRQRDKIVSAILGLGADVVGLIELENDGYGATSAIQALVDAMNQQAGAGTYTFINPGLPQIGSDAIAVGILYKPAAVRPVGAAAILDSSFVDPDGGGFNSTVQRPSLAQTFEALSNGARFTAVVNHLKSKGTSAGGVGDSDLGDGQGLSNGTRTRAAETLADWLATDPTQSGDPDFLLLGDLNAYAQEDPLRALVAGADNRVGTADDLLPLEGGTSYSYAFDGQWGALDHALATQSLARQVTGAAIWHLNADESASLDYNVESKSPAQLQSLYAPDPYRSSDHDPVVIGLQLTRKGVLRTGTAMDDVLLGTADDDTLMGGSGADRLEGGPGHDVLDGGEGNDLLVSDSGSDTLDGGAGFDIAFIGGSTAASLNLKTGIGTLGSATLSLSGIEAIRGSSAADTFTGLDGPDNLPGEVFKGAGGNDTISGGSGIDRAEFSGKFSDYQIARKPGTMEITVSHKNNGADGIDSLNSIELLVFQDRVIGFGQRAEEVARVAFVLWNPAIYNVPELFAAGLSFYTNEYAYTLNDLCKVALIFRPEKTAQELVATLLANTPGTTKTAAQLYAIMDANGGQSSQTGWAAAIEAMALDAATSAQLDLMGVAQNGLAATYNWGTQPCFWPLVGG